MDGESLPLISSKSTTTAHQQLETAIAGPSEYHTVTTSVGMVNKMNGSTKRPEKTESKSSSFFTFSRQTKLVLIFCASVNLLAAAIFAQIGPFFPQAAAKKGMSLTVTGFVFSSFQLVVFLSAPVFGARLTKLGAKFVFLSGIFVAGCCSILFGTLDMSPGGWAFILLCIITRVIQALGCAAFQTASVAIVSNQCKDAMGTAYAILETFTGLGFMLGPALGGALFTLGGFGLPFYVMGSLLLLNGVVVYKFLPDQNIEERKQSGSILQLLRSPLIVIALANIIASTVGITAYDSTFSTHLQEFNLEVIEISGVFVIMPGLYSILGPVWGYFTDTKKIHRPLLVIGLLVYALGWMFAGPSVLLPFLPHKLWTVIVGVVFLGVSFGGVIIPGMKCCVEGSKELGFESNLDTYALVSGLFNSCISLGGLLGPSAIGPIVQKWGYDVGYTVVASHCTLTAIITAAFFTYRWLLIKQTSSDPYVNNSDLDKVIIHGPLSRTRSFSEKGE